MSDTIEVDRRHLTTAYWALDQELHERHKTAKHYARSTTNKKAVAFVALGRALYSSSKYVLEDRRRQMGFES